MSKSWDEPKTLKKLGIDDFKKMNKSQLIALASNIDKIDPEVAKKAIEQFPNFAETTTDIFKEYKDTLDKSLESNNASQNIYYESCKQTISSLQEMLEKDDLSFEDKKYIIEKMDEICDKMSIKDSENKKFLATLAIIGGGIAAFAVSIMAAILGGETNISDQPPKLLK